MAKKSTVFFCNSCGFESAKWLGRCSGCGAWNSFTEEPSQKAGKALIRTASGEAPKPISEVFSDERDRVMTADAEFNRVVGGGLVPGSVTLLSGDPGVGKSTLILQILTLLAETDNQVLYVSGEESAQQIKLRADRLGSCSKNLWVLTETCVERVLEHMTVQKPTVVCLDSVQTLFSEALESAAGTVSQVRQVAAMLVEYAKRNNCITFLVGHVTKDGTIAGPRVLEHMVDTVLYFEGEGGHPYRILRTTKNRFGSTNEIGVFEMSVQGLRSVANPSELFLAERSQGSPGSTVIVTLEGTRPILVEVQSLTLLCHGGPPRRTCIGLDFNRAALLAAVVQRELHLSLYDQDLYVNVAGGMKVSEPAVDLGLVMSIASSRMHSVVPGNYAFFGEVGLTGEVRAVQQPGIRIQEVAKLGFTHCVLPKSNLKHLDKMGERPKNLQLHAISHIRELKALLQKNRVERGELDEVKSAGAVANA